ncbi:MAG: NADH-quinone oxidoreductase subunit M [Deltaproteobacteria bacterium]|nr:NADH-quinone oxidoreductase subunit M [Deltaproteobacteria bacterium]MBI4223827.1 NADH-quinone oxidoreductase subunit M [Deltaproteobacteria bacterium]
MIPENILSILIFLPLAGAGIVLLLPNRETATIKGWALLTTLLTLAANIWAWTHFEGKTDFEFQKTYLWIEAFNIYYRIGVDGVSFLLISLTNFIMPIAVLCSWREIQTRVKEYMFVMLVLHTGMVGTFAALDGFLFYVFWEVMLIPMYFLIGVWGSGRKIMAAFKFILYTMAGSLLMLVGILYIYFKAGQSFNLLQWLQTPFSFAEQFWLFLAFALAFAIKVPIFPLHTWLPDAHTEAPTAGSVILAGILLKMGTYGFYRFAMPLFPDAVFYFTPHILTLAVIGIVYGSLVAMVQKDIKRLVAYSSVAHLGFVMLGLFVLNSRGVEGAVLQMLNHGLSTGALFLLVGMIYERRHSRLIADYGGIAKIVPMYSFFFLFVTLSSVGLPGLNNFVGEFLVLLGAFEFDWFWAAVAVVGVVLSVCYMLWMVERVFFGPVKQEENRGLKDLGWREAAILVPMCALMLLIGVYPKPLLDKMHASTDAFLKLATRQAEQTMAYDER